MNLLNWLLVALAFLVLVLIFLIKNYKEPEM